MKVEACEGCPQNSIPRFPRFRPADSKGLHHSAQGCEPRATLGTRWVETSTLKGLHRLSPSRRSIPHIPFVVCNFVPLQQ